LRAGLSGQFNPPEGIMLNWSLTFLTLAVLGGLLGFSGLSGGGATVAKILSVCFVAMFLVSLALHRRRA